MGVLVETIRETIPSFYPPDPCEYLKPCVGNFIEIINFAIRRGDKPSHDHYDAYLSNTSDKDLIKSCANIIVEDITLRLKKTKYFSILADESMDMSGKEQLSFTLRFVEEGGIICEKFLGFVHLVNGLSVKDIAEAILAKVNELGLDTKNCRGQGYDGAGAVAG